MTYENELESAGIAAICNGLGLALRQAHPIPNWIIPLVLPVAGAIAACLLDGWNGHAVFKGLLAGFTAVGLNQAVRNGKEGGTVILKKSDIQ